MAKKHNPGFLALVHEARQAVDQVTVDEVLEKIRGGEEFHLVDVREDHEWDRGRVQGAIHFGRGILERDIENRFPNKATELVLYCGGGYRSALAAESLGKMGYFHVASMDGGFRGWTEAGGPVEGGDAT